MINNTNPEINIELLFSVRSSIIERTPPNTIKNIARLISRLWLFEFQKPFILIYFFMTLNVLL